MSAASPASRAAKFDSLNAAMKRIAQAVEGTLDEVLPPIEGLHARVPDAMRYAIFAGGKRVRPYLTVAGAALFDVPETRALRVGAAIECLHTYSLVHDDLPCMDDDDLRRGRPTTHRQYDEATAVLAGDALLTLSFGILADARTHPDAEIRTRLVAKLAEAGGSSGMIGGQMIDMQAPDGHFGKDEVILLQSLKTGALFEFSSEAGPILAGAGDADRARLRDFAKGFGLAFQIADDLIDTLGTAEQAGKAVGKDAAQGKATMVSLLGVEGARREAQMWATMAADSLAPYGAAADDLRALPFLLLDRSA